MTSSNYQFAGRSAPRLLPAGERVVVLGGALAGLKGVVVGTHSDGRTRVVPDGLEFGVELVIDPRRLRRSRDAATPAEQ